MLDPKLLRDDVELVAQALKERGAGIDVSFFSQLESQRKKLQIELENLQQERNAQSKMIGEAKLSGVDIQPLLDQIGDLGNKIKQLQEELNEVQQQLNDFSLRLPNLPHSSVPAGSSEDDNLEVRRWGDIRQFSFQPKDHLELGGNIAEIDMDASAKLSGARFTVLKGRIARLHRALSQFMLDLHVNEHGYQEVSVPFLVDLKCFVGTGQLPKFADDQFYTSSETHEFGLIPTGEVPLTNLVRDMILEMDNLPLRYVTHTPCFRKEAGSYGKDTRGIIRLHQFEKVELVQICHQEDSYRALEEITQHAETVLQKLELPYRVVSLCTGDLGFTAAKTYDLEVWLPSQNRYREISSCSNCTDFQARRIHARVRNPQTNKVELVHTLNGSGVAVGRALVAVLENYQDADGHIWVPKALLPYMGGIDKI